MTGDAAAVTAALAFAWRQCAGRIGIACDFALRALAGRAGASQLHRRAGF